MTPGPVKAAAAKPTRPPPPLPQRRLPTEVMQQILEDESLTRRDVLRLRRTNRWVKSIVDELRTPQCRLPPIALEAPARPPTVGACLRSRAEAASRTMAGQHTRTEFDVGRSSLLLAHQPHQLLLRCGNGRLLLADLSSDGRLFAEIAGAGTLLADENLWAATYSAAPRETWRVVVESAQTGWGRVLTCESDGNVRSQPLPRLPRVVRPTPFHNHFLFSSGGEYLMERCGQMTLRYFLGDGSGPIAHEAWVTDVPLITLCPKTGRRFEYVRGAGRRSSPYSAVGDKAQIFRDAFSDQVVQEMFIPRAKGDDFALSMSPDGRSFALWAHWVEHDRGNTRWVYNKVVTYDIPSIFGQNLSAKYEKKLLADDLSFRWYVQRPCWFEHPVQGWQFLYRAHVRTTKWDLNPDYCLGIQDAEKLVTLCRSGASSTALMCVTSLPTTHDDRRCEKPTFLRRFVYWADQAVLSYGEDEYRLVLGILVGILIGGWMEGAPLNDPVSIGLAFFSIALVAVLLRYRYLTKTKMHRYPNPTRLAMDLQNATLPRA